VHEGKRATGKSCRDFRSIRDGPDTDIIANSWRRKSGSEMAQSRHYALHGPAKLLTPRREKKSDPDELRTGPTHMVPLIVATPTTPIHESKNKTESDRKEEGGIFGCVAQGQRKSGPSSFLKAGGGRPTGSLFVNLLIPVEASGKEKGHQ